MKNRKWTSKQKLAIVLEGFKRSMSVDTERIFRTMKEDCVWINEWSDPFRFQMDLEAWIHSYNTNFPHQSLGYKTPAQFMKLFASRKLTKEVIV